MIKFGSKIMASCGKCGKDLEVFISRLGEGSKLKCAYCFTGYTASLVFRADEEGPVTAHP
ncbi:hypothetical protein D3C77_746850 [compost metagenome]